jgi:hypothetical protein
MEENPHYVTPDVAKNKRCQMSMNWGDGDRWKKFCIGPDCMAWRWAKITDYSQINPTERYSETHGYCGMVKYG